MAQKYLIVADKELDVVQEQMNEGANLGYRAVTMFPTYVPAKRGGPELFGYVALLELKGE